MSKPELPTLLKYPLIKDISERPAIKDQYCYVMKPYEPGVAAVVKYTEDGPYVVVGDWNGVVAVPDNKPLYAEATKLLSGRFANVINVMKAIQLSQAQFYISKDGRLVDMQVMLDQWAGPGMLRDLFVKIMPIPEYYGEPVVIDDEWLANNKQPVFLKTSKFKSVVENKVATPLYASVGV